LSPPVRFLAERGGRHGQWPTITHEWPCQPWKRCRVSALASPKRTRHASWPLQKPCANVAAMPSSVRVFSCASGTFCVIFTMWEEGKEIYLRCKGMALLSTRGRFDFRRRSGDGILSSWCYRSCFRIIVVALLFEKMLELSPVKQELV
jgi:hypothetical protein